MVWAQQGVTELRWSVPGAVDVAAAVTTAAAALAAAALAVVNRRRGWETAAERHRPAAEAVGVFADTVDEWVRAAARQVRRAGTRVRRRA